MVYICLMIFHGLSGRFFEDVYDGLSRMVYEPLLVTILRLSKGTNHERIFLGQILFNYINFCLLHKLCLYLQII